MSVDVLEKKLHALPEACFEEVSNFLDYILFKVQKETKEDEKIDEALVSKINEACKKVPQERITQDCTVATMWEAVKNDTW